jgi:hypothetical protein
MIHLIARYSGQVHCFTRDIVLACNGVSFGKCVADAILLGLRVAAMPSFRYLSDDHRPQSLKAGERNLRGSFPTIAQRRAGIARYSSALARKDRKERYMIRGG